MLGIFPRNDDMYRATLDTCNIHPALWVRKHEEYLRDRPLFLEARSLERQRQSPKCWVKMPTGCDQPLSETQTPLEWFLDQSGTTDAAGCASRKGVYNHWCQRNDAQLEWASKGSHVRVGATRTWSDPILRNPPPQWGAEDVGGREL